MRRMTAALLLFSAVLSLVLSGCTQTNIDSTTPNPDKAPNAIESTDLNETNAGIGTGEEMNEDNQIVLAIGDHKLSATLAKNSSAAALKELLAQGPLTISMRDYGNMEKVGEIGTSLPRNDEQITTEPGDLILYQGGAFVIYYAPNSWNFTRLGKIDGVTTDELKSILGSGSIQITLSQL